jgi:hypothetical protein
MKQRRQAQTTQWLLFQFAIFCLVSIAVNVDAKGEKVEDVQLLIYETDVTLKSILTIQASKIPGITATMVGQGTNFEGFGSKYDAVMPHLRQLDPETLVVLSDSRDVIINEPANKEYTADEIKYISASVLDFRQQVHNISAEYPGAIIVSAEGQCCAGALTYAKMGDYFHPDGTRKKRACYSGRSPCLWNGDEKALPWINFMKDLALNRFRSFWVGDDVYLNAGLIAGRAADLLRVFDMADFNAFEDDQAVLTDLMYVRPQEIILDYKQAIFGTNRHSTNGCMFQTLTENKQLIHSETGTIPLFIHSPGNFVLCHEILAGKLGVDLGNDTKMRRMQQAWKSNM